MVVVVAVVVGLGVAVSATFSVVTIVCSVFVAFGVGGIAVVVWPYCCACYLCFYYVDIVDYLNMHFVLCLWFNFCCCSCCSCCC